MATSVTSYVDVTDDINAPSPKYLTAPNTWQLVRSILEADTYPSDTSVNAEYTLNNGAHVTTYYGGGALFNMPVKMSDDETTASCMFSYGAIEVPYSNGSFNQSYLTYSTKISAPVFGSAPAFNSDVIIGKNVTRCDSMFRGCGVFDRPITIPNNVTNCSYMFRDCLSMNSKVTIGNNVTDCSYMFCNAISFKQNIIISDSVENCCNMFYCCDLSGVNIPIPKNFKFGQDMFAGHKWRDYEYYTISTNYTPNDVYIPKTAINCERMFANSIGRPRNIYISNGGYNLYSIKHMLDSSNSQIRVNVYCSNLAKVNGTNPNWNTTLVNAAISYSSTVNGYYNASQNIYLYQNYTG